MSKSTQTVKAAATLLATAVIASLASADVGSLVAGEVASLSTADIGSLASAELGSLATADVSMLGSADVAALRCQALEAFDTAQFLGLASAAIAGFVAEQIAALALGPVALSNTIVGVTETLPVGDVIQAGEVIDLFPEAHFQRARRKIVVRDGATTHASEAPLRRNQVLAFKDYGDHAVFITTDGQKIRAAA